MSAYNILNTVLECPRCGNMADMEIELYTGKRNQTRYLIGDIYTWEDRRQPQNGGRPKDGSCLADGYVECPICHRDFWVSVAITDDRIASVSVNLSREPFIPD